MLNRLHVVQIKFNVVLDPIKLTPLLKILGYVAVEFNFNFLTNSSHTCVNAEAGSSRLGARVRFQAIVGFFVGQSDSEAGFPPSTVVFPYHYNSTSVKLTATLNKTPKEDTTHSTLYFFIPTAIGDVINP